MSIIVETPFQNFTGLDGKPLTNGKVYIGQVGTDPTVLANQLPVFWDEELTIPASQPLQTSAGYIIRSGTPARVYIATNYSISVLNANNLLVYYLADFKAKSYVTTNDLASPSGAGMVGMYDSLAPSYLKVVNDLLSLDEVSILRFIDRSKWASIADGTNTDDLSSNFNAAMVANGSRGINIYVPPGLYNANNIIIQNDNTSIRGSRGSRIKSTTPGKHIIEANFRTGVTISGLQFSGLDSATAPIASVGGFASSATGLIAIANCTDVRIFDNESTLFYNGISTIKCSGSWVLNNKVTHWMLYGIMSSLSNDFHIDHNFIVGCDQTGAVNGYGVSATGDELGGSIQRNGTINFNTIRGIPSWDGIMTHDCSGLKIIGNDIRDVRIGVDIGANGPNQLCRDVDIIGNTIFSTTTNTYGASGAQHGGILVSSNTNPQAADGINILGNTIRNFFTTSGMVVSGNAGHIVVWADNAIIQGNKVLNAGSVNSAPGIYCIGTNNRLNISGNSLQGNMAPGGIRLASTISDCTVIANNNVMQTTSTDAAVRISGSTIGSLSLSGTAGNSSVPFQQDTSTITWANTGSFVLTAVGCTTSPTVNAQYSITGNLVTLTIPPISGTSNSTSFSLSGLPAFLQPLTTANVFTIRGTDNSATATNVGLNITTSSTIVLQNNDTTAGWTASGTKGINKSTVTYSL